MTIDEVIRVCGETQPLFYTRVQLVAVVRVCDLRNDKNVNDAHLINRLASRLVQGMRRG
jgi:hypothetical protein